MIRRHLIAIAATASLLGGCASAPAPRAESAAPLDLYLVRHGQTVLLRSEPDIDVVGEANSRASSPSASALSCSTPTRATTSRTARASGRAWAP